MPRLYKAFLPRIRDSVERRGILAMIGRCFVEAHEVLSRYRHTQEKYSRRAPPDGFDLAHGVETGSLVHVTDRTVASTNWVAIEAYVSTPTEVVKEALSVLPISYENFTFVDFGSGKGRILLLASTFPFRRFIVEFASELHTVAQENIRRYTSPAQRCRYVESICTDFVDFVIPAGPVMGFINTPSSTSVIRNLAQNLAYSLGQTPQNFWMFETKPTSGLFNPGPLFLKQTVDGEKFTIYANASAGSPVAGRFPRGYALSFEEIPAPASEVRRIHASEVPAYRRARKSLFLGTPHVKRSLLGLMQGCGLFALARMASSKTARILTYHNFSSDPDGSGGVTEALMRRHLEHLRRHFHVVPLAQLVAQLRLQIPLHTRAVALTVDDGRRNCYQLLFPLLQEFKMPATFFVVSSFVGGEDWIWTDKVLWLSEQPSRPDELATERIDGFFAMLNQMRPQVRNQRIEALARSMNVTIPTDAPSKYAPCSWSELREMADSGLVEIGSHTVTHPILASITDHESWLEMTRSRMQIEEGIGRRVESFCFPNGKPGDYRPSQVRMLKDAGYRCAVVTRFGMVSRSDDLYELPRIGVSSETDALLFSKHVDGAEYYQNKLRAGWDRLRRSKRR